MDDSMLLDNFGKQLTFTSLSYLIKNEMIPVNENAKARIRKAEDFFMGVTDALENITKNKGEYVPAPNLKRILEFAGYSTSKREMAAGAEEFRKCTERLKILDENPRRFYSEENYKKERLLKICESMRNLYDRIADEERLKKEREEEADY